MIKKSLGNPEEVSYSSDFYRMYADYLREGLVRKNHDNIFAGFGRFTQQEPLYVVDLGCGLGEYELHGHYAGYTGIDLNNATSRKRNFVQADYTKLDFFERLPFKPNAFVSLFSTELMLNAKDKYAFYERIFTDVASIQYGLVSGFIYENRADLEKVVEPGGVVSYQSIENPARHTSGAFAEARIYKRTPSKMFGGDVVEVWKMLGRR
ncbi:MAG: class I SAM-dependent methyltransferase [Candidatus Micrarchaeota archaeon]|nr:class I SAM-dependent methyltransferase [Candidatus Micrarchaeota archaeon]